MAGLANIFGGAGTSTNPSSGLGSIFGTPAAKAPGLTDIFSKVPTPITAPPSPYWKGSVGDTTFGPSASLDTSGKPLLDYRGATDNATTTDRTRVSTIFNPSVATTTPASSIQNLRDPSIRGNQPGSELDHSIPLELAGSNQPANLKYQPGIQGGVAAASDQVENQLAHDVQSGKISLFQAQTKMAKQKGLPPPVVGTTDKSWLDSIPDDSTLGILKNTIIGLPKVAWNFLGPGQIQDYLNTPEGQDAASRLSLSDVGKGVVGAVGSVVATPIADLSGIFTGPKSYNIPGVGTVNNIQKIAQDNVQNGDNPFIAIVKAVPQSIFDGLIIAGVAQKVFSPRESVVATGVKTNDLPGSSEVPPAKTFTITKPINTVTSSQLPPEAITQLEAQGAKFSPSYDAKLPTFWRTTPMANGVIKGEVVQLKPSYFDTFINSLKGDISKVDPAEENVVYSKTTDIQTVKDNVDGVQKIQAPVVPATTGATPVQSISAPVTQTPELPQKIDEPTAFSDGKQVIAPVSTEPIQSISTPTAASPITQPGGEAIQKIQPNYAQAHSDVLAQFELSEPGSRISVTGKDGRPEYKGISSTFPSWVPEGIRSKDLFNKAVSFLGDGKSLDTITIPPEKNVRQRALLEAVLTHLESKGVDTSSVRQKINEQTTNSVSGSNAGAKRNDVINPEEEANKIFGESPKETVGSIIEKYNATGRVAFDHPRSKTISLNGGREMKYPEAMREMKDTLSRVTVPSPAPVKESSITLQSTVIPGLDKFIEQDLKAAFKGTIGGVSNTWDTVKKIFAPATRGPEAKLASSIKREALGRQARAKEMAYKTFEKAHKMFDKYSKEESLKVIDGIETGKPVPGTEQFATIMHEVLNKYWDQVKEISGAESYIENYYPHMWKKPEAAVGILKKSYGKRPLEGTKSYLKQRTIPTMKEGVALGLEPESYNPVEVVMARINDMGRYIMAHDVWEQYKGQGLTKFVKFHGEIPQGWTQVEDKISKVFAPMELYNAKGEAKTVVVQTGSYYMPEQVATILKNYLAPGLQKYALYNGFRMVGNTLNQAQLGLSAFHAMFTTGDAIVSKTSLEIQKVFGENQSLPERVTALFKATISPVAGPVYVWQNIARGNKLMQDYYRENPQIPEMVDALERAGGRVKMDHFYGTGAVQSFLKALRSGNLPGAAIRSPFALLEAISRPLMEHLVPRQKLGVFADGAKFIMEQAQKGNWSEAQTTLRLQEFWDSVDNRMGQLVYDNLEWNKILKDGLMATVRSVGWNVGDLREAMGIPQLGIEGAKAAFNLGAKTVGSGKRFNARFKPKMGYVIALPYVMGIYGAIIYYLYHKKFPTKLKDLYAIPTNTLKQDGTQERIFLASYMKDVFAYTAEPFQTIKNKMHPEVSTILQMVQNQDYFGTEIRNPTDPLVTQIKDLAVYQAKQFVPFSFSNANQMVKTGAGPVQSYLEGFTGITPAPGYVTNSPLQIKIQNLYDLRFGGGVKSQDSQATIQQKSDIKKAYYAGDTAKANTLLQQAVKDGVIKPAGVSVFIKDADIPSDIKLFQQLPSEDQTNLIKGMELFQLNRYAWYVKNDVKVHFGSISANTKDFVQLYNDGSVQKPIWKKQQQTNTTQ